MRPKPAGLHKIVGQSIPRFDIPGKVTGKAMYVQDLRLPGMVHGRVVRPPQYGATLASLDDSKAKAIPGVIAIVRDGSFLGVIAEREEQAVKARAALADGAKWTPGPDLPDPANLFAHLKALPTKVEVIGVKQAPILASAPKVVEATYTKPYMAHASIGPSAAVAEFKDGKFTVWTHSQGVFPLRAEIAKTLKVPPAAVRCIHTEGSGCYGHNGADDVAVDSALLARAVPGRPVRLQWMRDDEFAWEPYGPAMAMQAKASLDGQGRIVDWNYEVWSNSHSTRPQSTTGANVLAAWYLAEPQQMGPPTSPPQPAGGGDRNAIPLYDFPNQRVVHNFIQPMPIRVSALRTLGAYANVFAAESFMDELALAAGADPVAFRLAHLKDPRAKAVIEKVAAMANWKAGAKGDLARGRGIGFSKYKNSGLLLRGHRRCRGRPRERPRARDPRVVGGRRRHRHQSGRAHPADRGRRHPVGELDAARGGEVRQARHPVARLVDLSDHDHAGGPAGRCGADQPAGRARARRRRRLARPGGRRDRQRLRARDRQAHPRSAVPSGARESCACVNVGLASVLSAQCHEHVLTPSDRPERRP